jgi:hypothetical protein
MDQSRRARLLETHTVRLTEPVFAFVVPGANLPRRLIQMKHRALALTLSPLLLAGTPILAKPAPSAPPKYLPSVVMPYNAYAPIFMAPMPEHKKDTGASKPDTPEANRNTPGAEAKS